MTILTALLEATLGAWLIAAVIGLLRLGFRRVLSSKAKYYLWVLLALRLMLPALPESPLSFMNFVPRRESAAITQAETASVQSVPVRTETEAVALPDISAPLPELSQNIQDSAPSTVLESTPEDHSSFVWQTVVLWVWLGGVGVVLLMYLILYAITARQLRQLPCVTDPDTLRLFLKLKRNLGIRGDVNLVSGGGGMLGGIFRPTIVIPAELQGQAVAPILVHELLHFKYKDLWVSLLFRVLTAIHWFNPVVWLCFHILRNDSEAACDQRVLESGLVERQRYATVLYEEGVLQMKNSPLMQTTFGGNGPSLKRRIRLIAQFRRPKVWMTVLTVVLAIVVSACTLTGAQSDKPESTQEQFSAEESPAEISADILERLSEFPSGYRETCKRTDLVVIDQGGAIINQALWDSFYSSVLAGKAAEVITARFSMEGDPILYYVRYDENSFALVSDYSRDKFGAPPYYYSETFSNLYPILDGNTEMYVLADERFDDLDAFNAYCQTGPEKIPQTIYRKPIQQAGDSLQTTISPYVLSGEGVTYGNTQWGMSTEQVFAAEELDEESWRYVAQSGAIMPREQPVEAHPEITDLVYYFNYTGPELEFGLNLVITRYDAQTIGFEQLAAQRTRELGAPGFQDETKASWEFPDGSALLLINDEDILDERLTASMSQFADGTLQNLDVEAYMEDLQAPNGHFGWTFDHHVEAGLLDPNDGTLEFRFEEEDSSESLYFHTTTELGGYEVPISYLFHRTLVSEEPVLTQVFVTPPEGVVYRDWVEAFWDPWKDKLYEQSSLRFTSPVILSSLLPENTQQALIDRINAQSGRTDATLTNWALMACWYDASANLWQFNGTGAALYLTATESD